MPWLAKVEAAGLLGRLLPELPDPEKLTENWAIKGREVEVVRKSKRIGFDQDRFATWAGDIRGGVVTLAKDQYIQCLHFSIRAYYNRMTKADFNRAKQRDVGEFLTNQVQGKLGELALAKLLKEKCALEVDLDFDVTGQIPSQDIAKVSTRANVWNNPAKKVSIKTTKLKNFLLAIPEAEASLPDRKSDIYVLSHVGLFPDHLLRLWKEDKLQSLDKLADLIPDFAPIPCRISGWILHNDLIHGGPMQGIEIKKAFGIEMASPNYVKVSGQLCNDWSELGKLILGS